MSIYDAINLLLSHGAIDTISFTVSALSTINSLIAIPQKIDPAKNLILSGLIYLFVAWLIIFIFLIPHYSIPASPPKSEFSRAVGRCIVLNNPTDIGTISPLGGGRINTHVVNHCRAEAADLSKQISPSIQKEYDLHLKTIQTHNKEETEKFFKKAGWLLIWGIFPIFFVTLWLILHFSVKIEEHEHSVKLRIGITALCFAVTIIDHFL